MQARMKNPAMIVPEAIRALQALGASTEKAGVPAQTLGLVHFARARSTAARCAATCTRV
jgi:hypothetical protein